MKIDLIGMILSYAGRDTFDGIIIDDDGRPLDAIHSLDQMIMEYAKAKNGGASDIVVVHPAIRDESRTTPPDGTAAARDVLAERRRQIEVEGYSHDHDDKHTDCEMAIAAALHAIPYQSKHIEEVDYVYLGHTMATVGGWKIKIERDYRRRLVKAGALILAEIERIDRAAVAAPTTQVEG